MVDTRIARTLAVLAEMARGKTITVQGREVGMTPDMTIGSMIDGGVSRLAEMRLSSFHAMLEREGIGMPIPDIRRSNGVNRNVL